MSDHDMFSLLIGFQDYDTFDLVIKIVKYAFEFWVTVDIWCTSM